MPVCVCAYTRVYNKKPKILLSEKTKKLVRVLTEQRQRSTLIQVKITQLKISKPENA